MIIELFTGRELALGVYILALVFYMIINTKTRNSAINLLKIVFSRHIVTPAIFLVCYAGAAIYGLSRFGFWHWRYLKDIIMWVVLAGIPTCFRAVDTTDPHYFRNIITDNLKLSAVVEFISGTFTFSFVKELFIQPILFILFTVRAFADRNKKYVSIGKFVNFLIALGAVFLLYYTVKIAVSSYSQLGKLDLVISFLIPIVFSVLYLPIAYLLAVYAKYQVVFARMNWRSPTNCRDKYKRMFKTILECKLSYTKLCSFEKNFEWTKYH